MPASPVVLSAFGDSPAALPSWSPLVFGALILVTLVLVVFQAVRYFRNDRDDRGGRDD